MGFGDGFRIKATQIGAFRNGPWVGENLKECSWAWGILVVHGAKPNYHSKLHPWLSFTSLAGGTLSSLCHFKPASNAQLRMVAVGLEEGPGGCREVAAKGVAVDFDDLSGGFIRVTAVEVAMAVAIAGLLLNGGA